MNHQHERVFPFPVGLSDREATTLCDFLFQLAADADACYLGQILRHRQKTKPTPQDPEHPWRSDSRDL